jgi:uncharacterized C2H2 Zn-finger protein
MPHKKITVVNIDDNDNKSDEVVDVTETIQETIEIPQEAIEKIETVEETMETPSAEDIPSNQQPETQTRSQELLKCPKCNKMVNAKTSKYIHKNTCSGEEQNKTKTEVKQEENVVKLPKIEYIRDIGESLTKPPKLVRPPSIIPEKITITPEMMREHRQKMMRDRINLRQDKMKNLFANSIT